MSRRCETCRAYVFDLIAIKTEMRKAKRFAQDHYGHGGIVRSRVRRRVALDIAYRFHRNKCTEVPS